MKANVVLSIISIVLSALIAYCVYDIASDDKNSLLCAIGAGICFASSLVPMLGLKCESPRLGINIRLLSAIFFIIFIISQFCYANLGVILPNYIIVNGILLVIYYTIIYKMQGIKDI